MQINDGLDQIGTNPFISSTISAVVFDLLASGATLTVRQICAHVGALAKGDRAYMLSIIARDLRWLYENVTEAGAKGKAQKSINMKTRVRMRPPHAISAARWAAQKANTADQRRMSNDYRKHIATR